MKDKNKAHQDTVLQGIRECVLRATPATAIYLFSIPTWNHPDHELMVITEDMRPEDEVRIAIRRELRELGIPVLLYLTTPDDFEKNKERPGTLAWDVNRYAILLNG